MPEHVYDPIPDTRTPEEAAADRAALALMPPGTAIRHAFPSRSHWTATVIRAFVDSGGEWIEMLDNYGNVSAGRPRAWKVVDADA